MATSAVPVLLPSIGGVYELRCHSCSHGVGSARVAMRLVGLFKASLYGRVAQTNGQEIRKRCRHCGWVNVFHPLPGIGNVPLTPP